MTFENCPVRKYLRKKRKLVRITANTNALLFTFLAYLSTVHLSSKAFDEDSQRLKITKSLI